MLAPGTECISGFSVTYYNAYTAFCFLSIPFTMPTTDGWWFSLVVKVKEVDLYSAFIVVPHTLGPQVRITQCYLQITPYLPLPRKHSPDGASPD